MRPIRQLIAAFLAFGLAFVACTVEDTNDYMFVGSGGAVGTNTGASGGGNSGTGNSVGANGGEAGSSFETNEGGNSSHASGGRIESSSGGEIGSSSAGEGAAASTTGEEPPPGKQDGSGTGGTSPGDEPERECMPGQARPCSEGGYLGTCATGSQLCTDDGTWGPCNIERAEADSCEPGNDDNCDGTANEGCPCVDGEIRSCAEALAMGRCAEGIQECVDGVWTTCSIEPAAADGCDEGNDDNCNGIPNEGCDCVEGEIRSCADGGLGGKCAGGTQTCSADGTWSPCSITPSERDTCEPDNDDNCNGTPNEGCPCVGDETRSCADVGAKGTCAQGIQQCQDGAWSACSITPAAKDTCVPGNDDNCNGTPNEGCECLQGQTRPCSQGGLYGKCAGGTQTCTAQGIWGPCSIQPSAEDTCAQGNDDNCNGVPNQGCLCINNVTTRSCGDCNDGTQVCTNGKTGQYGPCMGAKGLRTTYYRDADGDGWGSSATTTSCSSTPPSEYVDRTGDCCDSDPNVFPGQSEFFATASTACGTSWDYDCSGGVTTTPEYRGNGCRSGTAPPECETAIQYFTEANCGKESAYCGCSTGPPSSCAFGCGVTYTIRCK